MRKRKWMGSTPVRCDLCSRELKDGKFFYDFRMQTGPWALGCEPCFKMYGVGLGLGRGQKYSMATLEKVEG